jgi:tRNA dimethylallyltransferase
MVLIRKKWKKSMPPLIILAGPTTSKKSETAIELAEKINSEIISADSMQVYKYFNIGTAKVTPADRERIPHYLIDILEPDQEFSAFDFKTKALTHTKELHCKGKVPIITGGTGLYIKVLCENYGCAVEINPEIKKQVQLEIHLKGLLEMHEELQQIDPDSAEKISPLDSQRIERAISVYRQTGTTFSKFNQVNTSPKYDFPIYTFLIERDRKELYNDINERVEKMIATGWVDEVKDILCQGFSEKLKPFQSIGYAQIIKFLQEKQSLENTIELIKQDTRNYAKRQITWFKKLYDAKIINANESDNSVTLRDKILNQLPQTLTIFAFFLLLSFVTPESTIGGETKEYTSALAHFQKKEYHQAALLFSSIRTSTPNLIEINRSSYLLAHSLAHNNNLSESIKIFLNTIKSYPEIEDYTRFHLAEVFLRSKETKNALEQVNIIQRKFPKTLLLIKSNILLAKILEQDNKIEEALNLLTEIRNRISTLSKSSEYRLHLPEIIYYQGNLFQKLGQFNEAYSRYRFLHIEFPTNYLTYEAKIKMKKIAQENTSIIIKPLTLDEYEKRIKVLLKNIAYQQVVSEISELLKSKILLPANFYFNLAKAQKGLRKRKESNSILKKFLNNYPNHRRTQEALFIIGRNHWNTGYYRDGLKYFKDSIDNKNDPRLTNQARFFVGKMHEEKKEYSQATTYYKILTNKFADEYAERAAWQLGWMNYKIGNFKKSYNYFNDSINKYPSGLFIESSMYWSAKSAEKLKKNELAQQIFKNVNTTFPYTYYGIRGGEKRTDKKTFLTLNKNEKKSTVAPDLSSDAHFYHSRGVELSATGFFEDARLEIKQLERVTRKNLSGVIWLTKLYNNANAYSDTVRVMHLYKDFKTKAKEKELSNNFWKNFYPLAYSKTIHDKAKFFNVDPYFVKGLIRQESLFNAHAQSRAGAIGLMQIMPGTGRTLYDDSKNSKPFHTDILFNPTTNIELGVKYIHQLNKRFKNNKTHILISYNAGPHNLKKWLKRFSHIDDPDMFIESIPYPETRKYVKKVLRNYGIYQSLYPQKTL